MFDKINTFFDFNKTALNLYSKRQEILASNIANADTPGYHSMDIDFLYELKKNMKTSNVQKTQIDLKKTSQSHLDIHHKIRDIINIIPTQSNNITENEDNNTVDMNRERVEFLSNSIKYRASLVFVNCQIKNMISVIRG